ncbi:Uncharacterized protein dnl_18880 [Desulfonema limicola]|uniref:Uncharacterized protein n=1 Tax=Desulfonema limicola TaxID=45656 RepID=A0A975B699_9BACT|nr:Uncharacterized protein dnl_18880 [Desulfonema limicola]
MFTIMKHKAKRTDSKKFYMKILTKDILSRIKNREQNNYD